MDLQRALAFSRYAGRALAANPGLAGELEGSTAHPFDWTAPAANVSGAASAAVLSRTLRRLRQRVFLHTLVRDLTGRGALTEVCGTLTTLAEVALQAAVTMHANELTAAHGAPIGAETGTAQALIVIGMGKLGGGELNFSSDVDLVFLFPEGGTTIAAPDRRVQRPSNWRSSTRRQGRMLIRLLDAVTDDGFVFRVDMRLRPFGDSGPLVASFAFFEDYLQAAWPRLGTLRVHQGTRRVRGRGLRGRARVGAAPVRLPPLPGLRRVRRAARDEGPDQPRRGATRDG